MSRTPPPSQEHALPVDTTASRELARLTARAAAEKKASDIRLLEVGDLLHITDFFVLCSASNPRQLAVVVEEIERAGKDAGHPVRRREGDADSGWMLRDFGEVVVHAFTIEQRRVYALERLWADAPAETFEPADAVSGR